MSGEKDRVEGPVVFLTGLEGLLAGEEFSIRLGETVLVGRSRSCDVSTRKSKAFRQASEAEQRRILDDKHFLKVSRQHVRITYLSPEGVEVWDLSQNGTFVDEKRVDRHTVGLPLQEGVEIRLAGSERLLLTADEENAP